MPFASHGDSAKRLALCLYQLACALHGRENAIDDQSKAISREISHSAIAFHLGSELLHFGNLISDRENCSN
ncbi:MAG: hypothetical protein J0L70_29980 [Leptolyngbya sp. UWPOB_LEPTO1]|uniref:hypothetical protein n=1 Tax=Leptolyngbya sp. UWPOB_LEPTO1 TaxID=2815653 RepID=UPI001AD39B5C|nr:hypothetical protein [Leptolyngbya sp. UWPOB_LEPTO1]MBN8564766.1 hypothetical protein [Leptolyngbya sp. UWPOB_LEPTO1]